MTNTNNPFAGKTVVATGKLVKAQQLGVTTLTEEEFEAMLA